MEQNTTGIDGLNPDKGSKQGTLLSVIVSPMLQSLTLLMLAVIKPTSPGYKASTSCIFGVNTPTLSTLYTALLDIIRIMVFFFKTPS